MTVRILCELDDDRVWKECLGVKMINWDNEHYLVIEYENTDRRLIPHCLISEIEIVI